MVCIRALVHDAQLAMPTTFNIFDGIHVYNAVVHLMGFTTKENGAVA